MNKEKVFIFLYTSLFKNKALIETTWLSTMNDDQKDYENKLKIILEKTRNKEYKINL